MICSDATCIVLCTEYNSLCLFTSSLLYEHNFHNIIIWVSRPLGYERVYLPLCKVADTPFHIQGHEVM